MGVKMTDLAERVAAELLSRDGAGVIWQAHVAAARAYREGNRSAAEILLQIADAAAIQAASMQRKAPHEIIPSGALGFALCRQAPKNGTG